MPATSARQATKDICSRKMVILQDGEYRANEGFSSEATGLVTIEAINSPAHIERKYGHHRPCAALTCTCLGLPCLPFTMSNLQIAPSPLPLHIAAYDKILERHLLSGITPALEETPA